MFLESSTTMCRRALIAFDVVMLSEEMFAATIYASIKYEGGRTRCFDSSFNVTSSGVIQGAVEVSACTVRAKVSVQGYFGSNQVHRLKGKFQASNDIFFANLNSEGITIARKLLKS
jgi:hypothetical protein